jgi:hypothetical protein
MEIGNRQQVVYLPRQIGSQGKNDLLTEAAMWVRDETEADDEESGSFRDMVICGLGCTQTRMDYDEDPDGMIEIDRIDPMEMYWDPAARKQNYTDARFVMRAKDIPLNAAMTMFPDEPEVNLHAQWAEDGGDTHSPHDARSAPFYRIDQSDAIDRQRQMVRMVEVEWWEYEKAYRVLDPKSGRWLRMDAKKAGVWRLASAQMGAKAIMEPDRQKVTYKAIVGAVVLRVMKGADTGGFSYKAMTGKMDRNKGYPYGLVRAMRDPQMWANKWLSQSLHIVNTNAKGGLLAETDAFQDPEEARDSWADADAITWLTPGALGQGKIQQKQPPAFPAQINDLMQFAIASIPQVSGISPEMMAMVDRDQPGVLEMQRKQQGMTILADMFNAKRRYHKEQGRLMLWMIQTFVADGRLIRIGGAENAKYVQLIHDPGMAEYDVVVDEAPSSPNMKERVWAALMQLLPVIMRGAPMPPQLMVAMLKYAPFPASFTEEVAKIIAQPPPPNPMLQSQQQMAQAEAAYKEAQAVKAFADSQTAPQRLALEAQNTAASIDLKKAQTANQYQNAGLQTHEALQAGVDAAHNRAMDVLGHLHDVSQAATQPVPQAPVPGGNLPG